MMHLQRRDRNRLLEILLQLENKQQCGDSTQTYIGRLPYGTLCLHRDFTGVREKLNAMKHGI